MNPEGMKFSPLIVLLTVSLLIVLTWLFLINPLKPGLKEVGRAKIVEALLTECFANGLLLTARLEQNEKNAYEILSETEEYDPFSKTTHKVVTRGKKLSDPEPGCVILVKRKALFDFMRNIGTGFKFSEKNRKLWSQYTDEMRALGILSPGRGDLQVSFTGCKRAKTLYDNLQSFFAVSKGYGYNFDF